MPNPLAHLPSQALDEQTRKLERRLLEGVADDADIDAYVILAAELGRRTALRRSLDDVLDGIVDPRD